MWKTDVTDSEARFA